MTSLAQGESVLAVDVGGATTRAVLFDIVEGAYRFVASGSAASTAEAEAKVRHALASGAGVEKWREIVAQQGGDPRTVDDYGLMATVETRRVIAAPRAGYLSVLDAELVGRATVALGAGRATVDDVVDPAVGAMILAHPGDELLELLAAGWVHLRWFVGGEEGGGELHRLAGSFRSTGLVPRLVVAPVADHRLEERGAEAVLGVLGAEEVATGADVTDGVQRQ